LAKIISFKKNKTIKKTKKMSILEKKTCKKKEQKLKKFKKKTCEESYSVFPTRVLEQSY
jgi:hypothetical protein